MKQKDNEFLTDIARYFRDFIDTDFHRQRLPKRQVNRQDNAGNLIGISLKKYPQLIKTIWDMLHKPVETELSFRIPRGRYKATINKQLSNLIKKYIEDIAEQTTLTLMAEAKLFSRDFIKIHQDDPERLTSEVMSNLERALMESIVVPLLSYLETYFDENSLQGLETIFDIKDELGQRLVTNAEEAIGASLNTAIVSKDFTEYDKLIEDFFSLRTLQTKTFEYFQTFTASDFYTELHALRSTLRIRENTDIYIYIGDLHYKNISFPMFYLPLHVELNESVFTITIDPHLYINKRAIDYIAQEIARVENKAQRSIVHDRIVYLESNQTFAEVIQVRSDNWASDLVLRPPIDFAKPQDQKARSSKVTMTNRLHFAAFDKSDESLLNDYEALLTMAEGDDSVLEDFTQLIDGFLFGDPDSISEDIEAEWQGIPIQDRLVYRSPIPLNEEQRKIQTAVKSKNGRFIVCSGPPGTGKSHTITAIAFDAILDGRNVLILSDKTEALDVVEDKLTKTLNSVRLDDNFQNPILRLGKSSNTYHKIVSTQSIERIKARYRTAQGHQKTLQQTIDNEEKQLKDQLKNTAEMYQAIDLQSIYTLQQNEAKLDLDFEDVSRIFNDETIIKVLDDVRVLMLLLNGQNALVDILHSTVSEPSLEDLYIVIELLPHLDKVALVSHDILNQFYRFYDYQLEELLDFILRYERIRYPIFGFLFTRSKARLIDSELAQHLDCRSGIDIHRHLRLLRLAYDHLTQLNQLLVQVFGHGQYLCYAFQVEIHQFQMKQQDTSSLKGRITRIRQFVEDYPDVATEIGLSCENLIEWTTVQTGSDKFRLCQVLDHQQRYDEIRKQFTSIPEFDYTGQKTKIESLHTNALANTIDERVIGFHEKKRTTARAIRDIIRKKQKFPTEQFDDLKQAFPCIIANIRDYAEYMPLSPNLFDVIIIDEASQVSIAQAFPAILRAKKMVVLGDAKQFSNVKSSNASKALNNQYLNDIHDNFRRTHQLDANLRTRLEKFDIKTSILDFVDMLANYGTMLKKHFRGYQEHISFSSKYFYNYQLQAVKVRGKSVEEVLEVTIIDDDGKASTLGNVNELEGKFILSKILTFLELSDPPTVGIITPFTDQQRYLSQTYNQHPRGQELYQKLHLKIMTFDSCQGEEREYVFYSMVATQAHDRLYGIFPKSFQDAGDPEHNLRLQRLNVGFSRVQEKMHILLSKPVDQFAGALGEALRHYQALLEKAKSLPTSKDVDPKSPMEAMLLEWIERTEFYQQNAQHIEIMPQFPIGDYLKQLDHSYNHPAYRVDFLLRLRVEDQTYHLIIEYDGFKEHFTNLDKIDSHNYQQYYKAADVEREKILESYGYKILRINRFNMGKDPVDTLSDRLHRLTRDIIRKHQPHELVTEIGEAAEELVRGDRRVCQVCGKPKPKDEFLDSNLKSGIGRICHNCKRDKQRRTVTKKRTTMRTDLNMKCPQCGQPMVLRQGQYGQFYGCSTFPHCRATKRYRA